MIYSIKIRLSDRSDKEDLFHSIESVLYKNHFKVERNDNQMIFERITPLTQRKVQLIIELYKGFTKGTIVIDQHIQGILYCKIDYYKQLIVSLILGLLVTFIFSIETGYFWILVLQLGFPVALLFLVMGIRSGNSQMKEILGKAIKQ